jgi:hypothetical protein
MNINTCPECRNGQIMPVSMCWNCDGVGGVCADCGCSPDVCKCDPVETDRCWYCGEPSAKSPCDSESCRRMERELDAERLAEWRRRRRDAMLTLLRDGCCDNNYRPGFIGRAFYVFKAAVCLLLQREGCSRSEVEMCVWDVHPSCGDYSGVGWTSLHVGYGVFRNWHYEISDDTSY